MPIELTLLKERIQSPPHNKSIKKAVGHESRLKFHGQPTFDESECKEAYNEYFIWIDKVMEGEKVSTQKALFTFPVKTVSKMSRVFSVYSKVFEGRDPVIRHDFKSKDHYNEYSDYREEIKLDKTWRSFAMRVLRGSINSAIVIDLPREKNTTGRPRPYPVLISVNDILDFELLENGKDFEWIAFQVKEGELCVYDDESYRVFAYENKTLGPVISESKHQIGWCPASLYWEQSVNPDEPFVKEAPYTVELGQLRWLLFMLTSKQHVDLYAGNPVISVFKHDCNYDILLPNNAGRQQCRDGYLHDEMFRPLTVQGQMLRCPKCSNKKMHGPGSVIKIDPPSPDNEKSDLRDPIKIHGVDRDSLDYNVEECERLWIEIFHALAGGSGESPNDKAVNEKQVMSIMQNREAKIAEIQRPIETTLQWAEATICRIQYGDLFKGCSFSLGTEHYIWGAEEILDYYTSQKAAGASDIVLDILQDQFYETKYRNNKEQLERVAILKNLDPFRHYSKNEVLGLTDKSLVSDQDLVLKLKFSDLILRFERENVPVQEFGIEKDMAKRVEQIKAVLYNYITADGSLAREDKTP